MKVISYHSAQECFFGKSAKIDSFLRLSNVNDIYTAREIDVYLSQITPFSVYQVRRTDKEQMELNAFDDRRKGIAYMRTFKTGKYLPSYNWLAKSE